MTLLYVANDETFNGKVLKATGFVLVHFSAAWCRPSDNISRLQEELAAEGPEEIAMVRVDVDESPETARHYGIRGVPTLMLFRGGLVVATKVGELTREDAIAWIEAATDMPPPV